MISFWNNSDVLNCLVCWFTFVAVVTPLAFGLMALIFQKRAKHLEDQQTEVLAHELKSSQEHVGQLERRTMELNREIEKNRVAKIEEEKRRRTPPQLIVELTAVAPQKLQIHLGSRNLIPFEFKVMLATTKDEIVSGVPLEWTKVFPTTERRIFHKDLNVNWDRIRENYVELRFDFRSLAPKFIDLPGHYGHIVKKYHVTSQRGGINET